MNHLDTFKSARLAGCPIVVIRTPDYSATIREIAKANEKFPILKWDVCRGALGINGPGERASDDINGGVDPAITTGNPVEALQLALAKGPAGTILFMVNAGMFLEVPDSSKIPFIQGISNVRDAFKSSQRTLVLIGPDVKLPPELSNDSITIDVALPTPEKLAEISTGIHKAGEVKPPSAEDQERIVAAVRGLSSFSAEQVLAMALTQQGMNIPMLWDQKRAIIERAGGLKVSSSKVTFDSLGGLDTIKGFAKMILGGRKVPKLVVLIDEIEKQMAGLGDSNGINQDAFGQLLAAMQNYNWSGMLLPGFPGTGKTEFANALGNEAGGLFVQMDLGATKGSLVGQSEKMIRNAIQMLYAMGGEDVMFVGTCNSMAGLRPELKRRFGHGTFFFDLPSVEEVVPIWNIYRNRFELGNDETPDCSGWTGAEIRKCSQLAWELRIPLKKAAEFITPVAKIMGDEADKLRASAHMRYLSASKPGLYQRQTTKADIARVIKGGN